VIIKADMYYLAIGGSFYYWKLCDSHCCSV